MKTEKMTNAEARSLIEVIDEITSSAKNLPIKIFYALSRSRDKLVTAVRPTESMRLKLVDKYGEKTDSGTSVKQDKMAAFQRDWSEVMAQDIEVELYGIRLSDLESSMDGTPNIHLLFNYLIEEEAEPSLETVE